LKRAAGLIALLCLLGGAVAARAQSQFFYITPDRISFGTVTVGQSKSANISTYRSVDDGTIVTATSSHPAFAVSPSSQVVGTDGAAFSVRFQPTASGTYSGTITFSTGSDGQTRVLGEATVDGTGYAPFTVNPATLAFDPLLAGSSSSKTFRILVNPQAGALDFTIQPSNPQVYSVSPTQFSGLQSGQAGVVTVTFAPNAAGTLRGVINVVGGGSTVPVVVEGEGAAFLLSTPQIDLGGTLVGCSSSGEFTVTTGSLFDFSIVPTTSGLPFTVEPSTFSTAEPTSVATLFTPVGPGPVQGVLRVFARSSSRIVQQQDLAILGAGVELVADPISIDFGDVPAGTTSLPSSAVIRANPQGSFQGVYSASSNNPAFRVISSNTSGRVEIVFSPSSEGPASGVITVQVSSQSDRECAATVLIPVQGAGAAAPLTLSPLSLDFGMVSIGQTSPAQEVVISNQSGAAFTGTVSSDSGAFRLNAANSAAVPQTAITVPAGGTARVPVVFVPAGEGVATGTITFDFEGVPAGSGDPVNVTRTVAVRGEGIAANLSYVVVQSGEPADLSPGGTVNFGPTGVGSTSSVGLEVRNAGTTPVPVDLLSASDAPIFAVEGPALPTTIAPGDALTLTLSFEPTALAAFHGTLEVGSAAFSLEGSGVLGGAEINGVAETIPANSQPEVGVTLSAPASSALSGTLTMTYTPAGGAQPDPTVQFETGGLSVAFTVPVGESAAVFPGDGTTVGFQSGTIAANFVFSATLEAGETDVTPTPAPTQSGNVAGGAPVISSVAVESVTASGFTVVVEGFSPTREITQATFNFTGRNGIQVQPASVTPGGVGDAFRNWYQSDASAAFGSMFTLTIPFTISGETNAIASVSATISNAQGASSPVSASLP
jgi:Abnormal spindle-like microcephaly-assoc'd, ASPM-SPD-2-Hydin